MSSPRALCTAALGCARALALGVALLAARAHAQSCCSLVGEDEIAVVPPRQRALLGTRLAAKQMLFRHDVGGRSHALGDDVSATDLSLTLGAGLRLPFYDRLQLNGALPLRAQYRSLPPAGGASDPDRATAAGAGDATAFLRWSLLDDDERGLFAQEAGLVPALDLFAGAKLPTGRDVDGARARDLARTTGDETTALVVGARALKYLTSTQGARLGVRYTRHFAREADLAVTGYDAFAPGDQLGVSAGYWLVDGMHWLFGASFDTTWTFRSRARAPGARLQSLAGTEMRQSTLGVQVTHVLHMPDLELTVALASDLPLPAVSANVSWEGVQASVALRYHVLD